LLEINNIGQIKQNLLILVSYKGRRPYFVLGELAKKGLPCNLLNAIVNISRFLTKNLRKVIYKDDLFLIVDI